MNADLSVCRAALERDPVLYLDLTEAVRRGDGVVLSALPTGALVSFHAYEKDNQFLGFTMFADDVPTAEALLDLLPPKPAFLTVHETTAFPLLEKRFGLRMGQPCWQAAYLSGKPLPLRENAPEIRPLTRAHLPLAAAHYSMGSEEYLAWLTDRQALYGAFDGGGLMGFIGCHAEGSIGLLEVLPQYRRRGVASALQAFMLNLELSRGHIPYGQVIDGNAPSLALQASMGLTLSKGRLYWATGDE